MIKSMEYLKNILTMELKSECEYLNDKKYGEIKEYYENGQLKLEGKYLEDRKKGEFKEYENNFQMYK